VALLRDLSRLGPDVPRYRLAILCSSIGDVDRRLDLLEQAVERREDWAAGLRSPDAFRDIRGPSRAVR
jgi:hypothetical protein